MVVFWLFFLLLLVLFLFHMFTKKYLNPFELTMVFGKKGSGKTTFLVKDAYKYLRKGWTVYTTIPVPGCRLFNVSDLGKFTFPPRTAIFIDEVGMIWDNRDFKNFKTYVRDWFKLQRHYKCRVFLFSQTFDIDKKLRDLTDEMFLVSSKLRCWSYAKRILRKPVLTQPMGDSPARLDEELKFDSLLFCFFGSRRLTFVPFWAPYFSTFDAPKLPLVEYEEIPLNLPYRLRRRALGWKRKQK